MGGNWTKGYRVFSRRRFLTMVGLAGAGLPFFRPVATGKPAKNESPVCIFSKHLQFLDYTAMAETAADIGFDGVDLTVRPGGHVSPENVERDLPRAVEAVRKVGLQVPMMTTAITDPGDPRTEPILNTASRLGIRYYRMGYLSYDRQAGIAETLQAYAPRLRELAALNEKYGIHGAYQNHSGTRVGGPVWDLWELLKSIEPRGLGVQYDVRHATAEGGRSWPLGFQLLSPWIKITAIKDFYWRQENGDWGIQDCPLGQGMVDFQQYFGMVKSLPVRGPISLHFEYDLPGEELGQRDRTEQTARVMRRDLQTLRGMLAGAGP